MAPRVAPQSEAQQQEFGSPVTAAIRKLLAQGRPISAQEAAQAARVTRQGAWLTLRKLVERGDAVREGRGPASRYRAVEASRFELRPRLRDATAAKIWPRIEQKLPGVRLVPGNVTESVQYALEQILDNVRVHGRSHDVSVELSLDSRRLVLEVSDQGPGAAEHLRRALKLPSHEEAMLELAKGPATGDPERHAGEGLFFTARVCDVFELSSNDLTWISDNGLSDHALVARPGGAGTRVRCTFELDATRTLAQVFEAHTQGLALTRLRTFVRLAEGGVRFVSRSQAQRLMRGMERFREVTLDFVGVAGVGLLFADEIFRQWAPRNPKTAILCVGMNSAVEAVIEAARNTPAKTA